MTLPSYARVAALSDVGRQRSANQDSLLVADLSLHLDRGGVADPICQFGAGSLIEIAVGPKGVLLVVADGMGGALAGEVASHMAVTSLHEELVTSWVAEPDTSPERFAQRLMEAVVEANERIYEAARQRLEFTGMGTTLTVGGVLGDVLYLAQVGDSRAYLVRGGEAVQLSRDQSVVEHLRRSGRISDADAERSQRKNVLLQAMGTVQNVYVDLSFQPLRKGDVIALCSDGLTGFVADREIGDAVTGSSDLAIACSELVSLANSRGGSDNITVLLGEVDGPTLTAPVFGDAVGYASYGSVGDLKDPSGL